MEIHWQYIRAIKTENA